MTIFDRMISVCEYKYKYVLKKKKERKGSQIIFYIRLYGIDCANVRNSVGMWALCVSSLDCYKINNLYLLNLPFNLSVR